MGAAQSSNTAKAIAKIANNVSSNTTTSNNQIASVRNEIDFNKCQIDGDVNIDIAAQFTAKSRQIVKAMQQTHIQNSIAQQVQQEAQSSVGSLGIGYAESNNYVSTYASASTDIANMVRTVSDQVSIQNFNILCSNSIIRGSFNIDLSYSTSFWNDQGIHSQQVNDIANTITQTIKQKAVAKVEGLTGLLIILAILIALIAYAVSKPVGKAFKALGPASAFIAIAVIIFLVMYMYVKATPPFFSEQQTCSITGTLGESKCSFHNCKNPKKKTVSVNKPPLKYMYNIIGPTSVSSKTVTMDHLGMLNMVVFSSSNSSNYQFNQGYNALACKQWSVIQDQDKADNWGDAWNKDTTYIDYKVPQLPNPFHIPSTTDKDGNVVYCITPKSYNYVSNPKDDSSTPSIFTCSQGVENNYIGKDDFAKLTDTQLLGITAELNTTGWQDYFDVKDGNTYGDTKEVQQLKRALHARYILTLANGLDNTVYIFDGKNGHPAEEVSYMDKTILSNSSEAQKACYKFHADTLPLGNDYTKMFPEDTTGTITGYIGVCNTRQNKLNHALTSWGNWLLLIFSIILIVILIFVFLRKIIVNRRNE